MACNHQGSRNEPEPFVTVPGLSNKDKANNIHSARKANGPKPFLIDRATNNKPESVTTGNANGYKNTMMTKSKPMPEYSMY